MLRINNDVRLVFETAYQQIEHVTPYREEWMAHAGGILAFTQDTSVQVCERGLGKSLGPNETKIIIIATALGNVGLFLLNHRTIGEVIVVYAPQALAQTGLIPMGLVNSVNDLSVFLGSLNTPNIAEALKLLKSALIASEAA